MERLYVGTKFQLVTTFDGKEELRTYMLCESFEKDKIFQVICISGYHSGKIAGSIEKEDEMKGSCHRAISLTHLKSSLSKIFLYKKDSFKLIDNG